jgi:hypothetical protein
VPAPTPVTIPVVETTEAIAALLLVQFPPVVAELSVDTLPVHIDVVPEIAAAVFTVATVVTKQPVLVVYVSVVVPADIPVSTPDELPMVATVVLLLVQLKPLLLGGGMFTVEPTHTVTGVATFGGSAFTMNEETR